MALPTQPYKGARDFYPEDKRFQKYIFSKWRQTCEQFGYEEYDAPILESLDIYLAKTSEEIVNEQTYAFEDRGGRKVTLRPEMTPSVSRLVAARRNELTYPLRLYSVPELWRYERPQRGRLRQHWQLNADIFGVANIQADQEIIELADAVMQSFGASRTDYKIRLNSRALMDFITRQYLKLSEDQAIKITRLIDKIHKLEDRAFKHQLAEIVSGHKDEASILNSIDQFLNAKDLKILPKEIAESAPAMKLAAVLELLHQQAISNAVYDPTLMRGFDYYTDIVFEVFDTSPENNRSMFGGGRYDGLVGQYGVEPLPTVGFGMGDVTLQNFLETHSLVPALPNETTIYAILVGDVFEAAHPVIKKLREAGMNVAVDFSQRKIDKQLKTAVKKNIPYALFIGEKELSTGKYSLKDLKANREQIVDLNELINLLG